MREHLAMKAPKDLEGAHTYYLRFLYQLFRKVQQQLQSNIPKQRTYQDLASAWRQHMGIADNREQLYLSVVNSLSPQPDVRNFLRWKCDIHMWI